MFVIGDHVIFTRDGTKGIVVEVQNNLCQVIWEDHFVSWEKSESLQKDSQA
jgi:hypothetical protein